MTTAPRPLWKGLQTDRAPVFLGYDQTERMIAALLDRASAWQPDAVVGIARGGLVPASMAAGLLASPLAMIGFDRPTGTVHWIGTPPDARRILLVDDGCSTGGTMRAVRAALLAEGRECLTLAVVHDPETIGDVPDLSHPMRALWRFPWERGEATPTGRALRATGAGPDRATEAPFHGLDLDGVFLPDVPNAVYEADLAAAVAQRHDTAPHDILPHFDPARAVVITGRPEMDRALTEQWLARHGHATLRVECRPDSMPHETSLIARYKAEAATRLGCTHFVESDPAQTILIAAHAPHLVVSWWSAAEARAFLVGAAASPGAAGKIAVPSKT
jgi:adenine/guanine phosphoribosyltransferase-like PRPP-binding protein